MSGNVSLFFPPLAVLTHRFSLTDNTVALWLLGRTAVSQEFTLVTWQRNLRLGVEQEIGSRSLSLVRILTLGPWSQGLPQPKSIITTLGDTSLVTFALTLIIPFGDWTA